MDIRIATCPCSWGVWNSDGGPAYVPYETFLQQASECGYQEIELGPDGYLPMESDTLKSELRKYRLNVCAGTATKLHSYASTAPVSTAQHLLSP